MVFDKVVKNDKGENIFEGWHENWCAKFMDGTIITAYSRYKNYCITFYKFVLYNASTDAFEIIKGVGNITINVKRYKNGREKSFLVFKFDGDEYHVGFKGTKGIPM